MGKTAPWMVLIVAVAAAATGGALQYQRGQELEETVARLESELERERAETERLRSRLATAERSSPSPEDGLAGLLGALLGGETGADDVDDDSSPRAEHSPGVGRDEAGFASMLEGMMDGGFFDQLAEQMVQQQLGELDAAVDLTDREREEVAELLRAQARQTTEMSQAMLQGGENFDDEAFARDHMNHTEELKRILGDRRFEEWQAAQMRQFEKQREIGFQTNYRFFAQEVGLTPEQHDLVEPLMREYQGDDPSMGFAMGGAEPPDGVTTTRELAEWNLEQQRERGEDLRAQVAEHLDTEQLERFDRWMEQQEAQQKMIMGFMPDMALPTP